MARIPSEYRSIAELMEAVRNGRVRRGSTVEAAIGHPELAAHDVLENVKQVLNEHGVNFERSSNVAIGPIWLHPPVESETAS